jgi:hypothetical protein
VHAFFELTGRNKCVVLTVPLDWSMSMYFLCQLWRVVLVSRNKREEAVDVITKHKQTTNATLPVHTWNPLPPVQSLSGIKRPELKAYHSLPFIDEV